MQTMVFASIAIAAIFAALITVFLYYHNQTFACWCTFGLVVFSAFAACLNWQDRIWASPAKTQPEAEAPKLPQQPERVRVSVGPSLDPKSPYATRFILSHHFTHPIYNVVYGTDFEDPDTPSPIKAPPGYTITHGGGFASGIERLEPDIEQGLSIDLPMRVYEKSKRLILQLHIVYQPSLDAKPKTDSFKFLGLRDNKGKIQFIPQGAGSMGPSK